MLFRNWFNNNIIIAFNLKYDALIQDHCMWNLPTGTTMYSWRSWQHITIEFGRYKWWHQPFSTCKSREALLIVVQKFFERRKPSKNSTYTSSFTQNATFTMNKATMGLFLSSKTIQQAWWQRDHGRWPKASRRTLYQKSTHTTKNILLRWCC